MNNAVMPLTNEHGQKNAANNGLAEVVIHPSAVTEIAQNAEAEHGVIAGIISLAGSKDGLSTSVWGVVSNFINDSELSKKHSVIWYAIKSLQESGKSPNLVAVKTLLENIETETAETNDFLKRKDGSFYDNALEAVGGVEYLTNLISSRPSETNTISYAEIVFKNSKEKEIHHLARNPSKNAEKIHEVNQQIQKFEPKLREDFETEAKAVGNTPVKYVAAWQKPIPLQREVEAPKEFPLDALGTVLKGAVMDIHENTKAPVALIANTVLSSASLACQGVANVKLPEGLILPTSLYFLTIGDSSERKSGVYNQALRKHKEIQRSRIKEVNRLRSEQKTSKGKDEEPQPAIRSGNMLIEEPTIEGIIKEYMTGQPSLGLFNDEGGQMLAGHAMNKNGSQTHAITSLSKLWQGADISRSRAGDGTVTLYDRRLAIHLMAQYKIAAEHMLSSDLLKEQGLLSRFLVCYPQSTQGTRPRTKEQKTGRLASYYSRIEQLINMTHVNADGELDALFDLELTPEVDVIYDSFYYQCELGVATELTPEFKEKFGNVSIGQYLDIKGFAGKGTEHAARLAGVITLMENPQATVISLDAMIGAVNLVEFYMGELMRLIGVKPDDELDKAQELLEWLKGDTAKKHFTNGIIKCRGIC